MQFSPRTLRDGAVAGALATTVMTAFMKAVQWSGFYRDDALPPEKITERVLDKTGVSAETDQRDETLIFVAAHWAFGMVAGALFGLLHRRLRPPVPTLVHGTIFGLLVWLVSYPGWVPALGLMRSPRRQRQDQAALPFLAHVVYGASLGLSFQSLDREA